MGTWAARVAKKQTSHLGALKQTGTQYEACGGGNCSYDAMAYPLSDPVKNQKDKPHASKVPNEPPQRSLSSLQRPRRPQVDPHGPFQSLYGSG